ncbi:mechanosensitive ion channel family protein, partial [Chloroflexota bacterium]
GINEEDVRQRVNTLSGVLVKTGGLIIAVVALFMILGEAGINIAPALAGVGVVGIAVGFGAQNMIRDFLAGFFVLVENQYCVGDWVQIAGVSGTVQEVNMRRTVLRDFDGTEHSVPNGEITVASNYTKEWARVNMVVGVGYGEDLDYVFEVINNIGKELSEDPYWGELMLTPPQVLRVDEFGDHGVHIRILGDTKPMWQWALMGELRRRIKNTFDDEGIEIPWPHTKVYFGEPLEHRPAGEAKKAPKRRVTSAKIETKHEEHPIPD